MWNTGKVTDMGYMFQLTIFNCDLSAWDISNAANMINMFYQDPMFNQVLCWSFATQNTANMFLESGGGSVNPSAAKCSCSAGTYYTGVACASCPAGHYSPGSTVSCYS
jgi:hypothetical protein